MHISKTAPECIACKHYKDCSNKRMVMCAFMEMPAAKPTADDMSRQPINIEVSGYQDKLEDAIAKNILGCAFNVMNRKSI